MPRYRKKPVVIEAMQLTKKNVTEVMTWVGEDATAVAQTFDEGINISTKEGVMLARYGDYIIRGVHGEHYPCKPDIFEQTYESMEETWEVTRANAEEIVRRLRALDFSAWHNTEAKRVEYADNLADFRNGQVSRVTRVPYGSSLTLQLEE